MSKQISPFMLQNHLLYIVFFAGFLFLSTLNAQPNNIVTKGLVELRSIVYDSPNHTPDSLYHEAVKNLQKKYQSDDLDSLYALSHWLLKHSSPSRKKTRKALGFAALGIYHSKTNQLDSAIYYNSAARNLLDLDQGSELGDIYAYAATYLVYQGKYEEALVFVDSVMLAKKKYHQPTGRAHLLAGAIYQNKGEITKALSHFAIAKDFSESDSATVAKCALNTSYILSGIGLYEEARENALLAVDLSDQLNEPGLRLNTYSSMINLTKDTIELKSWVNKSFVLAQEASSISPYTRILTAAVGQYLTFSNINQARVLVNQGKSLLSDNIYIGLLIDFKFQEAKLLELEKAHNEVLKICREVSEYYSSSELALPLSNTYNLMSTSFESLGQVDSALHYLRLRNVIRDEIDKGGALQSILLQYITYKTQIEQDILQKEKETAMLLATESQRRARLNYWLLGLLCLFLSSIALFYYIYYHQRDQTAAELYQLNENLTLEKQKIEETNSKLNRFNRVISHDILSNLDLILSTGNMLLRSAPTSQKLTKYYEVTQSICHHLKEYCIDLLKNAKSSSHAIFIQEGEANKLLKEVLFHYKNQLAHLNFKVETEDLRPLCLPRTLVLLVFHNLLTNAIKYVPQPSRQPSLSFRTIIDKRGNSSWEITDNGPGIQISPQTVKNDQCTGRGIGLELVQENLNKAGYRLTFAPAKGGTRLKIEVQDA